MTVGVGEEADGEGGDAKDESGFGNVLEGTGGEKGAVGWFGGFSCLGLDGRFLDFVEGSEGAEVEAKGEAFAGFEDGSETESGVLVGAVFFVEGDAAVRSGGKGRGLKDGGGVVAHEVFAGNGYFGKVSEGETVGEGVVLEKTALHLEPCVRDVRVRVGVAFGTDGDGRVIVFDAVGVVCNKVFLRAGSRVLGMVECVGFDAERGDKKVVEALVEFVGLSEDVAGGLQITVVLLSVGDTDFGFGLIKKRKPPDEFGVCFVLAYDGGDEVFIEEGVAFGVVSAGKYGAEVDIGGYAGLEVDASVEHDAVEGFADVKVGMEV